MRYSSASGPNRCERQRDRAHLEHRDVGDRGLGPLRQDDRDRSPRFTPSAASAFDRRFAACWMSQKEYAAVAPDSSSQ